MRSSDRLKFKFKTIVLNPGNDMENEVSTASPSNPEAAPIIPHHATRIQLHFQPRSNVRWRPNGPKRPKLMLKARA